jgi:type IX secretion system PorP/SprF family membrane protein
MKNIILLIFAVGSLLNSINVIAQQDAQYTQYMYNMNILNPAYAGSIGGTVNASLLGRSQWVGVPGAPQTTTLSVHSPITQRMGLGLSILADKIGPINEQFIFADYSYTIPVGSYDNLAFGVKAGISLFQGNLIDLKTVADFGVDINFSQDIANSKPNFGFGAFYYSDIYYFGASVPNLLNTTYFEKDGAGNVTNISKTNHLFLTGGYVFDVNYDWKFKPSFMTKMAVGAPLSVDLSANFLFDEAYEIGTSYRWDDSVSLMMSARIFENLRVGYSYDFTTTGINAYNSGSHELILLFNLVTSYEIVSPRFF